MGERELGKLRLVITLGTVSTCVGEGGFRVFKRAASHNLLAKGTGIGNCGSGNSSGFIFNTSESRFYFFQYT